MCHVLTVFTFTASVRHDLSIEETFAHSSLQARYAYRSIAEFVKHVTEHPAEHVECNPFPEHHLPTDIDDEDLDEAQHREKTQQSASDSPKDSFLKVRRPGYLNGSDSDIKLFQDNKEKTRDQQKHSEVQKLVHKDESQQTSTSESSVVSWTSLRVAFTHFLFSSARLEIKTFQESS